MSLYKIFDFQTIEELSLTIDIKPEKLLGLYDSMSKNVKTEFEPKKRGGFRKICKPSSRLKKVQKTINKRILQLIPLPQFLHGGVKGRSTRTLAQEHVGMPFILSVDIKDFYPNIHYSKIFSIFRELGCSGEVAKLLTKLCTYDGSLAQGFPTSSSLANLTLARIAPRFEGVQRHHGVKFGSFQDDLIISGGYRIPKLFSLIKKIMQQEGFVLHLGEKKKLMPRNIRQEVVGYVVNQKVNIPREYYRNLSKTLQLCKTKGIQTIAGNIPVEKFKQSLKGQIIYVKDSNPSLGKKLLNEFESL